MKKNFKLLLSTAILVSSIAVFAGCDTAKSGANGANPSALSGETSGVETVAAQPMSARDVYALSAVSGVSYLAESTPSGEAQENNVAQESGVAKTEFQGVESCINAFDNIVAGGGFEQTVRENASADTRFEGYALEMTISLPLGSGDFQLYTLYFNELNKTAKAETDDGVEEVEERTTFEGVLVYGEELFIVKGFKEVETEGKEKETSLEFRTYKNIGVETLQADESNFVAVSQSVENGELEYEYAFYENGRKVREFEVEYEETARGVELSFQMKGVVDGKAQETEYELRKIEGGFLVEFEKNGRKSRFTVKKTENGYEFSYGKG